MNKLVYFRSDLRTHDHPALRSAIRDATRDRGQNGGRVIAVFMICPDQWNSHDWADIRVEFTLRTLRELRAALDRLNIPLRILTRPAFDDAPAALLDLANTTGCDAIYFNDQYELDERVRDAAIESSFRAASKGVHRFTDQVLFEPGTLRTGGDEFYKVYTPFKRRWLARFEETQPSSHPDPSALGVDADAVVSDDIPESVDGFGWSSDQARAWAARWPAGEHAATDRLDRFLAGPAAAYATDRDRPDLDGTSTLSPHLACGSISFIRCIERAVDRNAGRIAGGEEGIAKWIEELIWREFYRHILVGFPRVCRHRAFRTEYERVAWNDDPEGFEAWCAGRTGFPIVDAAMRQLRETGWMHNRLRMIAAMFLTKDLLIDWRLGERFFMRSLIDGDLASNNGGWQWAASTGTDAQPYFRVFNPTTQGEKCDPDGSFVRRYVPELADVDGRAVHDPGRIPPLARGALDYPAPIVDHARARERAIAAFRAVKG